MTMTNAMMIEHFYDLENDMDLQESLLTKVTLQGRVEDIAMLNAISERFGQTRFSLSREILNRAVSEMFFALSPDDQKALSVKADLEITEHMKKAGFSNFFEYGAAGSFKNESGHWRTRSALIASSNSKVDSE